VRDFYEEYEKLLTIARESGIRAVPVETDGDTPAFRDQDHVYRFLAACHGGYREAQRRVVVMLTELADDASLSLAERADRTMLLRRALDGIAWLILRTQGHVVRRLADHDEPPPVQISTIAAALAEAERLNDENEVAFALLADLTTFIHVADILRADFRRTPAHVSFIELKSGRVNDMLMDALAHYGPTPAAIAQLERDPNIDAAHLSQAKRMMRQKIRLAQVGEVLKTDDGIDLRHDMPIRLPAPIIEVSYYDDLIQQLCDNAAVDDVASGVAGFCIHLSVAASDTPEASRQAAFDQLKRAIAYQREVGPAGVNAVAVYGIDRQQHLRPYDLLPRISTHSRLGHSRCGPCAQRHSWVSSGAKSVSPLPSIFRHSSGSVEKSGWM